MAKRILVTGGSGTVGRVVTQCLLDSGVQVRVLSRGLRPTGPAPHVVGDVKSGEGLAEAVAGVDTVVHCVDPAHHVVDAALRAGRPHRGSTSRSSELTGCRLATTGASSPTNS